MTEEQKDIILLGSRYEIMNRYIDLSNDDLTLTEGIAKAMQHYAELYHSRQLSKLHQTTVSDLVGDAVAKAGVINGIAVSRYGVPPTDS